MFGELDDSNIYESFDAFSDGNEENENTQDFSFGDVNEQQGVAQPGDDFLDMSSYSERMEQQPQQDPAAPSQTDVPKEDFDTGYDMPQDDMAYDDIDDGQYVDDSQYDDNAFEDDLQLGQMPDSQAHESKKSSGGAFFLLLLILLAAAAGGLFYYKKYMAPSDVPIEQSAGDYFYDRAQQGAASNPQDASAQNPSAQEPAAQEPAKNAQNANPQPSDVATIDVDLSAPSGDSSQAAVNADTAKQKPADKIAQKPQKPEKELTPFERAKLKEKQDEQRKSQIGLSSNRVTIPVVSGGRVDPFVPYGQRIAAASAPKFDLIAPPADVPSMDPVVDDIVQTKISGIMYDAVRPSAIINIGGVDQLVHKGDVVNGFSVLNITKNSVTLKYKTNIYQASVGQNVSEGVNLNPVSNLSKSFGGAYSDTPKNIIRF